jgi:hypothetical protein
MLHHLAIEFLTSPRDAYTVENFEYRSYLFQVQTIIPTRRDLFINVAMSGHYVFDDLRSLKTKINEKAYDLFKEKPGTSPLQVTRIISSRVSNGEEKNVNRLVRDQDVWKLPEVKTLAQVRDLIPSLRKQFIIFDVIELVPHVLCCP